MGSFSLHKVCKNLSTVGNVSLGRVGPSGAFQIRGGAILKRRQSLNGMLLKISASLLLGCLQSEFTKLLGEVKGLTKELSSCVLVCR